MAAYGLVNAPLDLIEVIRAAVKVVGGIVPNFGVPNHKCLGIWIILCFEIFDEGCLCKIFVSPLSSSA